MSNMTQRHDRVSGVHQVSFTCLIHGDCVADIICGDSDIFSFYKEELAGERNNYVHNRRAASGQTLSETLAAIVNDAVASVERGRHNLKGKKSREVYEQYVRGYIYMHFSTPRYYLDDIFGTDYV